MALSRGLFAQPDGLWPTVAATTYSLASGLLGVGLLAGASSSAWPLMSVLGGALLAAHGRIVASYLVHDAAHTAVFKKGSHNTVYGVLCLWLRLGRSAGVPYCSYRYVKKLHLAHHYDRADTGGFDHRAFTASLPRPVIQLITGLEFCLVPVVEVIMHVQTALKPLFSPAMPLERRITALTGTLAAVAFHCAMWRLGGAAALGGYGLATALWLHGLAVHDCFQHTFETLNSEDPNYKSGPGPRTAAYEQENTYSDLISVSAPWLNLLFLNFGYHNAHHAKANVPWYQLPAAHAALFGSDTKQVFPMAELMGSWWRFRTRRVLDESYGFVERRGELFTDRAKAFVGSLGVSFLTV